MFWFFLSFLGFEQRRWDTEMNRGMTHSLFWELWGNGKGNGEFERTFCVSNFFFGIASELERQFASKNHDFWGVQVSPKWEVFFLENNDGLRPHPFPPSLQWPLISVCVALFCWPDIGESLRSRGHSLNQGSWGGRSLWVEFFFWENRGEWLTTPPPRNFEGMGMGMGILGEWQTRNDSLTIRECHFPDWQREWPSLVSKIRPRLMFSFFSWVSKTQPNHFLSFFLGFRRPNLITGLSEWRTPDQPLRTQEPVPDRRIGALPSLW